MGAIANAPTTGSPQPLHMQERLAHIEYYMDDATSVVQGRTGRKHRVFEGTVRDLKWILPYLLGDTKDL